MVGLGEENTRVVTITHTLVQIALDLFNCSANNLLIYINYLYTAAMQLSSYIASGHYLVTNSNGTHLIIMILSVAKM